MRSLNALSCLHTGVFFSAIFRHETVQRFIVFILKGFRFGITYYPISG